MKKEYFNSVKAVPCFYSLITFKNKCWHFNICQQDKSSTTWNCYDRGLRRLHVQSVLLLTNVKTSKKIGKRVSTFFFGLDEKGILLFRKSSKVELSMLLPLDNL